MKQVIKNIGWLLCLASMSVHAAEDNELSDLIGQTSSGWQVVKLDKLHGISTYYKREDGKRYRSFRAESVFDNTLDASACHQLDIDNYPRWFMNVEQSRILKRVSDTELYMYLKLKAPLGVPARDVPLHVVIQPYSSKHGEVVITYSAVPDYLPATPGVVRVPVFEVVTRLSPLENGRSHEVTEGYAEPGGPVPAWLVNYLQRQMPYANSLGRSRDIPRYEGGKIPCQFKYKE
jgi:hypothetical protein